MELTYYDSRPRPEGRRNSAKPDSSMRGRQDSHGSPLPGTRQSSVVKRRPLPGDPASAAVSPAMGPREYNGESQSQSAMGGSGPLPLLNNQNYPDEGLPEAMPGYSPHDHMNKFNDDGGPVDDEYHVPMSDDPYALQALEDSQSDWQHANEDNNDYDAPRNDRVDALSNYSISRSNVAPLQHTYSAPEVGPYETVAQAEHGYGNNGQYNNYHSPPPPPARYNYDYAGSANVRHSYDRSRSSPRDISAHHPQQAGPPPPPPPTHRNSAPNLPRMAPMPSSIQYSGTPTRALHMATSVADLPHGPHGTRKVTPQRHSYSDPHSLEQEYNSSSPNHRQYSQNHSPYTPPYPDQQGFNQQRHDYNYQQSPSSRPQAAPFDPRRNGLPAEQYSAPRGRPLPLNARPQPSPQAFNSRQSSLPPTPQYRSQPQSPNSQQRSPYGSPRAQYGQSPGPPMQSFTPSGTPYRSLYAQQPATRQQRSPMPSPHQASSPQFQNSPGQYNTPSRQAPAAFREPVPMYASSPVSPTHLGASTPTHLSLEPDINPLDPSTPLSTSAAASPIIGADGRVKDPSDHLPESSYAPEPLRKPGQGRPSINVTMKNRFGPRELEVNKSPLGARSGNTVGGGPPPVPGKMPLESPMSALDLSGGKSGPGGGGGVFGRFRKGG